MTSGVDSLKNRQVVILSSIDWDAAWQRHQVLAKAFADAGCHVLYVENTGFRNPRLSDIGRIMRRILRIFSGGRPAGKAHPVPKRLRIISPLVLPPTHRLFRLANRYWLLPALVRRFRRRALKDAIVIAYVPTQTTLDLLYFFWPRFILYDVVDYFAGHATPPADLLRTEEELIKAADLIFTTSPFLQDIHKKRHPHALRVHHGVSEDFFIPPPKPPRKHRRLLYFGTLRIDLDYRALNALAQAGFHVSLIGPAKDAVPPLHPAITRIGMVSPRRLLKLIKTYDALLLPYTSSEWNKGITPAKIYEYFATGLPVLASRMPGLAEVDHLLYTARDSNDFVAVARSLDAEETPAKVRARIDEARRNSAASKFALITKKIREGLARPQRAKPRIAPVFSLPRVLQEVLKGLTWITIFFTAAKAATLLAHITAARLLGPEQYGAANLILAIATLVQILPMMGFPLALAHFAPREETDFKRRRLISTILSSFAVWSMLCLLVFMGALPHWAPAVGLDLAGGRLALLLAFLTAWHLTASGGLQGLTWFRKRGAAEALYGGCALLLLAALAAPGAASSRTYVLSLAGGLALATAYSLYQLRGYLSLHLHSTSLRGVTPYALVGTLNILAAALVHAPGRICLVYFASNEAAGVYSAYFTATAQIALAFITMAWTVLVPLTSLPEGQTEAWRHLRRKAVWISAGGLLFFAGTGAAAVTLIGRSYSLQPLWVLLFAGAAAAILTHGLFAALFAARGLKGLGISAVGALLTGAGNLGFNLLLTPRWGISGAAASLFLGYALGLAWYCLRQPGAAPPDDAPARSRAL